MTPIHIHIPYPKLKDYFEMLKKRRYDLEIYFSASVLDQLEKSDVEKLRASLDWNPALTVHAPFSDLNPGAVDAMVRSATRVRFRQIMDVAAILKPRCAVFHSGYDRWSYSGRGDIWLANSLDAWHRLADTASGLGVKVAVENVFDEDPEALTMLLGKVDSKDFGICFDTGHFNLFSKASMEQWFSACGNRVIELHLHDNDGTEDAHWAVGRGAVDFEKLFRLVREHLVSPIYTVEAHDKDDVETSIERVRAYMAGSAG